MVHISIYIFDHIKSSMKLKFIVKLHVLSDYDINAQIIWLKDSMKL